MSRIDDDNIIGVVGYLMFKKVVIEGANTISSPLTYGFPAITGFLGSFHAMSRKMVDDELWLKLAMNKTKAGTSYVFTDVRFDLEANAIRQQGGIIIHLDGRKADLQGLESHASEQGVTMVSEDYFVDNSGSLDELYTQLKGIICE